MKKYSFIIACLLTTSVVADNRALYDPETDTLEIPEVIIEGQEGEYYVEMKRTEKEGLNFEVTLAEKDADEIEDSDELRTTFDPITGIVEIPLVAVFSPIEDKPLKTFSAVKMLKDEGDGLFFTVTGNPKLK